MNRKLQYAIATAILITGFMVLAHGSRLILKTYERESIYIETVKIGKHPVGHHATIVKQKGLKDGLLHIMLQSVGITLSIAGGIYISQTKEKYS